MARAYNVIDADGHILEPLNLWTDYIEPKYRDKAPKLIRDADGKQRLQVGEQVLGSKKGLGALGGVGARDGTVVDDAMEYEQGRKGGFDPHARIPDMDLDGIDAAFLYPSIGLFAGAVQDPPTAAAMSRAYNRWLADYCKPYPDRLFGVAMIPMQSVDLAIEEMRYAREKLGFRGVFLRPNPYNNKMIHHPDYEKFWTMAEELDIVGRLPRGRQQRHDAGRHGPLRGARCTPHHHPHDGDDAGLHGGDLGRRVRASSEDPHRVPRVRAAAGSPAGWIAWTAISTTRGSTIPA